MRPLLAGRRQMQSKVIDLEQTLRGLLRGFGSRRLDAFRRLTIGSPLQKQRNRKLRTDFPSSLDASLDAVNIASGKGLGRFKHRRGLRREAPKRIARFRLRSGSPSHTPPTALGTRDVGA